MHSGFCKDKLCADIMSFYETLCIKMWWLESNASCLLFHAVCKLQTWTFHKVHYNNANGIVIFQHSPHIWQQSSSTFEQEHEFLQGKSCSPCSAATGAHNSAVPHHPL